MMHRSKKLLGSGDQGYFNEKRPVNVRVDGTAHFTALFPRPGRKVRVLTNLECRLIRSEVPIYRRVATF